MAPYQVNAMHAAEASSPACEGGVRRDAGVPVQVMLQDFTLANQAELS